MRITRLISMLSMVVSGLSVGMAAAQDFPNRSIRLVGSLAGGSADLVMRLIAPTLTAAFGQPVVIDNRPGNLLGEIGSKTPPDGYTVLVVGNSFMIERLLRETTWDPIRDFLPVTLADAGPNVLVVHPSMPVKTVRDMIALAKARPGELNYASGPSGSTGHLAAELFKSLAGVNIVRVSYKIGVQSINDLASGQVQMTFAALASVTPHVKSGRIRVLAVTSAQPSPLLPGSPTVASTVPGYEVVGIDAAVVPAKTPAPIVNRLNQEIVRALNQPNVKETLFNTGVVVVANSPEEFGRFLKSEIAKWDKVIKDAKIRPD